MLGYELPVMPARIDMRFMRYMAIDQESVHPARTCIKAVAVVVPAIEIDFEPLQVGGAGKNKWRVLLPEPLADRRTEGATQKPSQDNGTRAARKLLFQSRHVRGNSNKHLRVFE